MTCASAVLLVTGATAHSGNISFSGYTWDVRPAGTGGPGPNDWDPDNVWVDAAGYLHLKLTHRNGRWYSSEVYTRDRLGFGRYQFSLIGRVDQLDKNIVFGLFNYPTPDVGVDTTREIDIEFSRWGAGLTAHRQLFGLAEHCRSEVWHQAVFLRFGGRVEHATLHLESEKHPLPVPARTLRRRYQRVCKLAV